MLKELYFSARKPNFVCGDSRKKKKLLLLKLPKTNNYPIFKSHSKNEIHIVSNESFQLPTISGLSESITRRSTVSNLAIFSKYWIRAFSASQQVVCIYTNFSKAFLRISHIFLYKLSYYYLFIFRALRGHNWWYINWNIHCLLWSTSGKCFRPLTLCIICQQR